MESTIVNHSIVDDATAHRLAIKCRGIKNVIFISHSKLDDAIAHRLATKLKQKGKKVWIDSEIKGGEIVPLSINKAMERCGLFILLWSQSAKSSIWVEREWAAAYNCKQIIPCLLDETPLPILLQNTCYIDFRNFDKGVYELLKALR